MSFAAFLDRASLAEDGVVSCTVDSAALRAAMATVRIVGSSEKGASTIRCVLRPDTLKLSAFARGGFSEELVPAADVEDVAAVGVAWLLEAATLATLAGSFPSGRIKLRFDAARRVLAASSGSARVEFPTETPNGFPDHRDRLGMPQYVSAAPIEMLRTALKYAGLLSAEAGDAAVANLAVVDLDSNHKGMAVGGSTRAMLSFQSGSLAGLSMDIPGRLRGFVSKALTRLDPAESQVFRSETYTIVIDSVRMFGWERPAASFPVRGVLRQVQAKPLDLVQLSRAEMRQALVRVGAVTERNGDVQISASGQNEEGRVTLRGTGTSGRLAEDSIGALRAQQAGSPMFGRVRTVLVPLAALTALVSHFSDGHVTMSLDGPVVRIFDKIPDATAISVLVSQPVES